MVTILDHSDVGARLTFSQHMTTVPADAALRQTYLGQAHIAGTGPKGATCRLCKWWHTWKWTRPDANDERERVPAAPGFYSQRHPKRAGQLKPALCNFRIMNKAKRNIPHFAKACRLFEPNESPPPVMKPVEKKQ